MTALTVPVTITIGKRTWLAGSVPDLDEFPEAQFQRVFDYLLAEIRTQIDHAAVSLATDRDAATIIHAHRSALIMAIRTAPDSHNPTGPMARVLRESAAMTRADLARAMRRDPRSVRNWEEGRPSKFTIADDLRASSALGFAPGALTTAYMALA